MEDDEVGHGHGIGQDVAAANPNTVVVLNTSDPIAMPWLGHVKAVLEMCLDVAFRVTNTGSVAGDEVPQVYLGSPASPPAGVPFADRALAGYSRITLRPGQSPLVGLHVPLRQIQYWDSQSGRWVTAAGPRPLYVAGDERSTGLTATITVPGRP